MHELNGSRKARICSDPSFCGHRTYGTVRAQVSISVSFVLILENILPASRAEFD